jgi:hypothetical protein
MGLPDRKVKGGSTPGRPDKSGTIPACQMYGKGRVQSYTYCIPDIQMSDAFLQVIIVVSVVIHGLSPFEQYAGAQKDGNKKALILT